MFCTVENLWETAQKHRKSREIHVEKGRITAKELYTICKALIDKTLQEYAKYVHIVTEMWKECGEKIFACG